VIELKKGIGALLNTSGHNEHWECYNKSIGQNPEPFIMEMEKLLSQKQMLALMDKNLKIEGEIPEFLFAYSYDDKHSKDKQDTVFRGEVAKIGKFIPVIKATEGTFKLMDK